MVAGIVTAVSRSPRHTLVKPNEAGIRLLAGLGVEGDAHQGVTVKHRSRVAKDPTVPNLRQVHLIHAELIDELRRGGVRRPAGRDGRERHDPRGRSARSADRDAASSRRRARWSR